MQINKKLIYFTIWLLCQIPVSLFSGDLGITTVIIGASGHIASSSNQTDIIVGSPFIGAVSTPSGSPSSDIGQFGFFRLPPEAPIVSASDGEHAGFIRIEWSLDPLSPPATGQTQIYRDGSAYPINVPAGISYYDDEDNLDPGILYNYEVIPSNYYGEGIAGSDIGFINPNGIITGNVKTPNNNGVPNVFVSLEPSNGFAVALEDTLTMSLDNFITSFNADFAFETWIKTEDSDCEIMTKGNYELKINSSGLIEIYDTNSLKMTQRADTPVLNDNQWHHLAFSHCTDLTEASEIFIDSSRVGVKDSLTFSTDTNNSIVFGDNFTGSLDDIRFWSTSLDSLSIVQNMNRILGEQTLYLEGYWPLNEGMGIYGFDGSLNSNKLTLETAIGWTTDDAEVNLGALTDSNGEFVIRQIPFEISGTTYTVIPILSGHIFDPEQRLVTLSSSNISADNVTFIDNSLIPVSGIVKYDNTDVRIEGAHILINGEEFLPPVVTGENGEYVVDLEHGGDYTLSVSYREHNIDKSWTFENLISPKANRNFKDLKTEDLTIEVKGSADNQFAIGAFEVTCTSVNGDFGIVVDTDCYSTNYEANPFSPEDSIVVSNLWNLGRIVINDIPPIDYNISVDYRGMNVPAELDSLAQNPFETEAVSLENESAALAFNWRASMNVEIEYPEDIEIGYFHPDTTFAVVQQNEITELVLRAYEDYSTVETPDQKAYLEHGVFQIVDDISQRPIDDIFFSDTTYVYHELTPFLPNIQTGYPRRYQNQIAITMYDEELERYSTGSSWALIEGEKPLQNTFNTTSPEIPFLILHDPPGDTSHSFFNQTSSQSISISSSVCVDMEHNIFADVSLGPDFSATAGTPFFSVGTNIETVLDFSASTTITSQQDNAKEQTWTMTTTEEYTTSEDDQIIGEDSDLFVGAAINIQWGATKIVSYNPEEHDVDLEECVMMSPQGFETTYIYTKNQIINTVIPNLLLMQTSEDSLSAQNWQNILEKNNANMLAAEENENHPGNISFNAGAGYLYSEETTISSSNTVYFENTVSAELGATIGAFVNGVGAAGGYTFSAGITIGASTHTSNETSTSIGFVLGDDDESSDLNYISDYFTIDIKKDPVYGTPVFNLISGASSCPWEPNTTPREGVLFSSNTPQNGSQNLPEGSIPSFELVLGNDSRNLEDRRYFLNVLQHTNSTGATVKINGVAVEDYLAFDVNYGSPVNAILTVEQGPGGYEIDDLILNFSSQGNSGYNDDLALYFSKELEFDISWEAPYSVVVLDEPAEDWIANIANEDTLWVEMSGYDLSKEKFAGLKLQYKRPHNTIWLPAFEILPDSLTNYPYHIEIPWDIAGIPNGVFQIRAAAMDSVHASYYTEPVRGLIDRVAPEVLGIPEPSDHILELGDEISISFEEQIDPATVNTENISLTDLQTNEQISCEVDLYENKVVLIPNVANYWIENQTLRAAVSGLRDHFGNAMTTTVTWEFYVNRNPIGWNVSQLDVIKPLGEPMTLSANLSNSGGQYFSYVITDYADSLYHAELQHHSPEWLTVLPGSGQLIPLDSHEILFQISDQIGFGHYETTLYAQTAMGNEAIHIEVDVLSNPPDWSITNFSNFQSSMSIYGELDIEGEISNDANDIIGAFIEDENGALNCRGVANIEAVNYIPNHPHQIFLTIYSDEDDLLESIDDISFRVWDNSENKEFYGIDHSVFGGQLSYLANEVLGSPLTPVVLSTKGILVQDVSLNSGWTWFSANVDYDPPEINDALNSLDPTDDDIIKNQFQYSQYFGDAWVGQISSLNNKEMYKINMQESQTLEIVGAMSQPQSNEITYYAGWNWIGYISQVSMSVNQAMENRVNQPGDFLKNQNSHCFYVNDDIGWIGSLRFMNPGEGFMLYAQDEGSFQYPSNQISDLTDSSFVPIVLREVPDWTVDPWNFEYSANLTIELLDSGLTLEDGNYLLGAFTGDECRGYITPIEVMNKWLFFLTAYSNVNNEEISFRVYDADNDEILLPLESFTFTNDLVLGSPSEPFQIELSGKLPTPQNVTIQIVEDQVVISWDSVAGANSYKIYAADSPEGNFVEVSSAGIFDSNEWSAAVTADQQFYYVVSSRDAAIDNSRKTRRNNFRR